MIAKREVVLVMGIGSREEVGEEVRMKEVNDGEKETGGNDGGEVGTNEKEVGPGDRKGKKSVVDHNDDIGVVGVQEVVREDLMTMEKEAVVAMVVMGEFNFVV